MTGAILCRKLDSQTEGFIQRIKEASHRFAFRKLRNFLFMNNPLNITYNNVPRNAILRNDLPCYTPWDVKACIENIFKRATHITLQQYITNLILNQPYPLDSEPLKKKSLSHFLQHQCERIIAKILFEKFYDYKNDKTIDVAVERLLLQSCGYSSDTINERIDALHNEEFSDDSNEEFNEDFNHDDFYSIFEHLRFFIQKSSLSSSQNNEVSSLKIKAALDYVEYKVKSYLSAFIQEVTSHAIHNALKENSVRRERVLAP